MRPEQIRDLLDVEPFRPFRVVMTDGREFDIRHPAVAFLTRSTLQIGVEETPGWRIFDRVIHCSLLHIMRIEPTQSESLPLNGQNGPVSP